jgi:protein-tyrosine phosphatase
MYDVPTPTGVLSLMACPPDLATFKGLKAKGVTAILSMLSDEEAKTLGMAKEAATCARLGLVFLNHPIEDFGLPRMATFAHLIQKVTVLLETGDHVAVHCRAGIGRSGMVAACALVALGKTPEQAQEIVSAARGAPIPDTREQSGFVADFAAHWKKYPTLYR